MDEWKIREFKKTYANCRKNEAIISALDMNPGKIRASDLSNCLYKVRKKSCVNDNNNNNVKQS